MLTIKLQKCKTFAIVRYNIIWIWILDLAIKKLINRQIL